MENVAIFYGGKSSEHDISIITAIGVIKAVQGLGYEVVPVYIGRDNSWHIVRDFLNVEAYTKKIDGIDLAVGFYDGYLLKKGIHFKKYKKIDVAINCCHGLNGEDGTLAGLIALSNIAMVGSGVLASSVGMDKAIMKDVFKINDIPCVKYLYFTKEEYDISENAIIDKIENEIGYPVIVKPSNLGSSIGINISNTKDELQSNIETALSFDKKVVVEEVVENLREINCSVIGNFRECEASILEEPKNWKTFLNFDEKYILAGNNKRDIDVHISNEIDDKIKTLSKKCFKVLGCSGVVRIDFLLNDKTGDLYVNEINTIPGSYANYLWRKKYTFGGLIQKLIDYAKEEHKYNNSFSFAYKSNVLENYSKSSKLNGRNKLKNR